MIYNFVKMRLYGELFELVESKLREEENISVYERWDVEDGILHANALSARFNIRIHDVLEKEFGE